MVRRLPAAEAAIQNELSSVISDMESKMISRPENLPTFKQLPLTGLPVEEVEDLLCEYQEMDNVDLSGGRVSGTVYGMDEEIKRVIMSSYNQYLYSNPLHPDVFKSVRKMEAEVVAMTLSMFHGNDQCVGTMTSGGTESILLACKAYRDRARVERNILFPEIIAPVTAHAAFDKAAHYFGIRLVHCETNERTGKVDTEKMKALITPNTIALVVSTPCFSLGVMDDVEAVAEIALEYNVGLHVDCCLGSFLLPQLFREGLIAPFDFLVPGVTSISADPHKYGFAPKGSSIVMYNNGSLRQYQYYVSADWTGGIYATPTLLGSRPGAVVASTWSVMLKLGQNGYRDAALQINSKVEKISAGIRRIEGLFVYGKPASSVVAFGSEKFNVYSINDELSKRGWHLNALQNPPALHIACTLLTSDETVRNLLFDLEECTNIIKLDPRKGLSSGTAAIYGTNAALPDKSIVEDVAKAYVDILYKL